MSFSNTRDNSFSKEKCAASGTCTYILYNLRITTVIQYAYTFIFTYRIINIEHMVLLVPCDVSSIYCNTLCHYEE